MKKKRSSFMGFSSLTAVVKKWRVEDANGRVLYETQLKDQRLNIVPVEAQVTQLRLVPLETWGAPKAHVFALEVR